MFSLVRASTRLTNTHHSANGGRTLTQKPAQRGGGSLVCVGLPHQVQCSYHHGYKEIQVGSVEGQTTTNTVGPIMLATQGEEIQRQNESS